MKDANLADVHNGLSNTSNPTSKTSRTAVVEIHTTLVALSHGIAGGLTPQERRGIPRDGAQIAAAVELIEVSPRATRTEVAVAGREALRAGHGVADVARACGVTRRTAERWARQVRAEAVAA